MISSPIEEIKNRLDIVDVVKAYIKLEKAGANFRAVCPFHSEKKPSFFVSPSRQIWHCFGACGTGGNMFDFVMRIEGVEFGDALRILAQKAGVELKREDPKLRTERERLYEISDLACRFFEKQLGESLAGREAKKYLLDRGLREETIRNWRLGYAPDSWQGLSDFLVGRGYAREETEKAGLILKSQKTGNYYDRFRGRIVFPILDLSSQVVGFGARVFKQSTRPDNQEEAKYINSPGTILYDKSKILYGLNRAGIGIRKKDACILVEGYTDALLCHQAGFENVVATSGTALTDYQLKILKRYSDNLLTAFDMDIAGDSATKRGIDLAQALGFNIKVVTMPNDSDPADIISQNPQNWESLIENSKTIHDFYFDTTLSRFDKNSLEGKKEISKILLPIIRRIPNKIEQAVWIQSLGRALEVREEDISAELEKIKDRGIEDFVEKTSSLPSKSRKELLEERLILLSIKIPERLELIKEEDLSYFSSQTCQIFKHFKGIEASLSDRQKYLVDILSLKAEVEENDIDFEQEFKNCLREFRRLVVKNRLDEISKEIKKAEEERNFQRAEELSREFNNYSKSICDLEAA